MGLSFLILIFWFLLFSARSAVKRIMLEVKELGAATFEYFARPLEVSIVDHTLVVCNIW